MATAVDKVAPKAFKRKIAQLQRKAVKANTIITGRQVIHCIYNWFRTESHMAAVFDITHLADTKWLGDSRMEEYLEQHDHIVDNMEIKPSDQVLRDIMYRAMCDSTKLKEDCAYYRREKQKGAMGKVEDVSYEYLRGCIERVMDQEMEDRNVAARAAAYKRGAPPPVADGSDAVKAPAASAKPQPKPKAKVKAKGQPNPKATPKPEAKAPPRGRPEAKGDGRGTDSGTAHPYLGYCYFYNAEKRGATTACRHGDNCRMKHELIPDPHWATFPIPKRSASPAPRPKAKGEAKGKGKGKSTTVTVPHCSSFLQTGKCKFEAENGYCRFAHHTKDSLAKERTRLNPAV
jgi:hypothetical protein